MQFDYTAIKSRRQKGNISSDDTVPQSPPSIGLKSGVKETHAEKVKPVSL